MAQPMPPLWQELNLDPAAGGFCRFKNLHGNEYLYQIEQLTHGLELCLNGYEHQVFQNFRVFQDTDGRWHQLHQHLQGRAVEDLDRELLRMLHQPLWQAFAKLLEPGRLHVLAGGLTASPQLAPIKALISELTSELLDFATALCATAAFDGAGLTAPTALPDQLEVLPPWLAAHTSAKLPEKLLAELWCGMRARSGLGVALLGWLLLQSLGKMLGCSDDARCLECLHSFGLDYAWRESATSAEQERDVFLTSLLMLASTRQPHPATSEASFAELINNPDHAGLLGINRHADQTWFTQEGMTVLAGVLALQAEIMQLMSRNETVDSQGSTIHVSDILRRRLARAAAAGYRLDKFLDLG